MSTYKEKIYNDLLSCRNVDLTQLEKKFEAAAKTLVESAKKDIELQVAMTSTIAESSVTVQNYRIDIVVNEFAGRKKQFYNIVETDTNTIIHRDLALFETAMALVKRYMTGKISDIEILENFDNQYSSALHEVWTHNFRAKREANQDVFLAKADAAKRRVVEAKQKILKRL
jgi:hypothetical protein